MFDFLLLTTLSCIINQFSWRIEDSWSWWIVLITTVIGLATYIAFIYKLNKKTLRTSISIILTLLILVLLRILTYELDVSPLIIILILAVLLLILVVLARISNIKKLKLLKGYYE